MIQSKRGLNLLSFQVNVEQGVLFELLNVLLLISKNHQKDIYV